MVNLHDHDALSWLELWNQDELVLWSIMHVIESLFLTHEIIKLLVCMNIVFLSEQTAFSTIPFFITHFLEPVDPESLNEIALAFVDALKLIQNMCLNIDKVKLFENGNAYNCVVVLLDIKQERVVMEAEGLTANKEEH